ncbi:MAG: hypothetical protein M3024_15955 [Candidatus Dormibacteraeota bacterium]|nr:hypothetical protein [Candidatus Dormibacteraeota bacterium]
MTDLDVQIPTRATVLSRDGKWWWNGRRWLAAVSDDGLWRWDGQAWRPLLEFAPDRPRDMAAAVAGHADQLYAQGGAILAARADEWEPDGSLTEFIEQCGAVQPSQGEFRTLTARIGRAASPPTLKEADDLLAIARALDARSAHLLEAAAAVETAQQEREQSIANAERAVEAAEAVRGEALARSARAVDTAETDHGRLIEEARTRLRRVRTPGPGDLHHEYGPYRLHGHVVFTPDGAASSASARVDLDTAAHLWERHREVLGDLVLLGSGGANTFYEALTTEGRSVFMLVTGRSLASITPVADDERQDAAAFASAVTNHAEAAIQAQRERELRARIAEDEMDAMRADRSLVDNARQELKRVEDDQSLLTPIWQAQRSVEAARLETPTLIAARERLRALVGELTAQPPGLTSQPPD